jgi:3-oxoacyl-[acyl-carrier protein] reductase
VPHEWHYAAIFDIVSVDNENLQASRGGPSVARFTDKVAIITGSGRGIGKAIAEAYAAEGGRVVINDMDRDVAEESAEGIKKAGGQAIVSPGSVTNQADVDAMVKAAVDRWGTVDAVVNNAGVTRDALIGKMSDEQWDAVIDTHLKGPFYVMRAVSQIFIDKSKANPDALCNGKIVNISSTSGLRGNVGQVNYSAAKAGILGMTLTMAREWGRFRVNVNAVAFGVIETRMTEFIRTDQKQVERLMPQIILGRYAKPEEVCRPVLFMLSSDADYITGECLYVTGGLHMSLGA